MPRPVAFRPPMRDAVLQALAAGSTYRDAVGSAGIPWSTWRDWCRYVREDRCTDPDVEALVRAARETYAKATNAITAQVRLASSKDWRAAAFLLEHRRGNPKALHDARKSRWEAELARAKTRAEIRSLEKGAPTPEQVLAALQALQTESLIELLGRVRPGAPAPEGT